MIISFLTVTLVAFSQKENNLESIRTYFPKHNMKDVVITDQYTSQGVTHTYFQQAIGGIPVYESRGAIHEFANGSKPYTNNNLIQGLQQMSVIGSHTLTEAQAVISVANIKGYQNNSEMENFVKNDKKYIVAPETSKSDIPIRKIYFLQGKKLIPGYELTIEQLSDGWFYKFLVNANSGEIHKTISLTLECNFDHDHTGKCNHNHSKGYSSMMTDSSYNVYAWPLESPNHGSRSIEVKPWEDSDASPDGWHDINGTTYTVTRGNNVDAYIDADSSNGATNGDDDRADGGANLSFDFPHDLNGPLADQKDASVSNLFYWNNVTHDVMHNYGFDEASGNFQEFNYGAQGSSGDYVFAEAQDGAGTCNANFSTPADGNNPRMQMFNCTQNGNARDGSFDNGVIIHEYGHGISIRLTGGPATSGCLNNQEQMGEGWSDYFAMVMTMETGDAGTDSRGMGTYLFGQDANGAGIRPYPYSTDMTINPMTYATIGSGVSVPHGVGSVWATMLWDLTWALVDEYGFSSDLYDGDAGNNKALKLVIEALKLQPCNPGFVDGRDAIIAADAALYGGENKCLIWESFANRGLGYSAGQGSSGSVSDGTEAFDLPPSCSVGLEKFTNISSQTPGNNVIYTLTATNLTEVAETNILITDNLPEKTIFVSATDGGTFLNDTVSWPEFTLNPGESKNLTFTVEIDPLEDGVVDDIIDDLENGIANWTLTGSGSTSWVTQSTEVNSGTTAFFANDGSTNGVAEIEVASIVGIGNNSFLSFFHKYDTEATWDGGVIEISIDNGSTWVDLGPNMTDNGYNSTINGSNGRAGFSGNSNGWVNTIIDLSPYNGNSSRIRFQMNCDAAVGGNGWWIDDITLTDLSSYVPNVAKLSSPNYVSFGILEMPTLIEIPAGVFNVEIETTDATCNILGSATANATGGSGTYTYEWSNGAMTGPTVTDLAKDIYTVTVSDGAETKIKSFIVGGPESLNADAYGTPVSAPGLLDGTVTVEVNGGSEPFIYSWSNGATTNSVSNLGGGDYFVTVTDDNGCISLDTARVVDELLCTDILYELSLTFDQFPEETGFQVINDDENIITSEGTFGNEPDGSTITRLFCLVEDCYTLKVTDTYGDGICGANSNPLGTYSITRVEDGVLIGSDCFTQFEGTIDFCAEPPALTINSDITEVSCNGTNDGRILAIPIGGSGNYTYSWDNGETTEDIQGLSAGFYSLTVDDGVNQASATFEVLGSKYSRVLISDDVLIGSLRDVLSNGCASDTVLFSPDLINDPIILTNGEILITSNKTIRGLGSNNIFIDAELNSRIFNISPSATVVIEELTLQNGTEQTDDGSILNEGNLTLKNVNIKDGTTRNITNKGTLIVEEGVNLSDE